MCSCQSRFPSRPELVERKRGQIKTTQSRHSLPVFLNLAAEMEAMEPNQIWVSDLTYIRTEEGNNKVSNGNQDLTQFTELVFKAVDRKTALLASENPATDTSCFHMQQCVEKHLYSALCFPFYPIIIADDGTKYACNNAWGLE